MRATLAQPLIYALVIGFLAGIQLTEGNAYYGRLIGSLDAGSQGLRGDVYAVDARTLFIKGFSYDGQGEDTVFLGGSSPKSGSDGFVIPNESGSIENLAKSYDNQDLTLTLPEGKTLKEVKWVSVFNRIDSESLGEVKIPTGFDYPRPQRLNSLAGIHKVNSDRIYVVDAQTFLIPNFTYDGAAPDAFFWVGNGNKPSQEGIKVPDENGRVEPLRQYDAKTLVLTMPGELTVFDVDWISVWCKAFDIDFAHIRIPKNLNVPPSLKMLGVAPQAKLNCEVLWDDLALEVRWAVAGETIVLQLVGKIDDGQYVAFGPSGDPKRTRMIGADMAVGWLDRQTGKGFVHDYHATSKNQCNGGKGVCQDALQPRGNNNIRLLNAALVNEYVMLTYQRPLKAQDDYDRTIITNGTQAVIWAVGPRSSSGDPSYHKLRNKGDILIDFGRSPFWNCPAPEEPAAVPTPRPTPEKAWTAEKAETNPTFRPTTNPQTPQLKATKTPKSWFIPPIECYEPENHVFYAHIGPSGGAQGYNAITGHVGWNIAWYINGLLIPEVTVVRGETYTFVVEGGQDPDRPARHHPFYITDDPEGGYEFKTPDERSRTRVFAGVTYDREGNPVASASGRLCEWVEDPAHPADAFTSFGAYQRTLKLHCEEGQPTILQWTPDQNTPDTVFYQCYTHRFLGWKIRVIDGCDAGNNRKQLDLSAPAPPPSLNNHNAPVQENADSREGIDYEQEYYDEEPTSVAAENERADRIPLPPPKPPAVKDATFFGESAFPKFPTFPDDVFGKVPFGNEVTAAPKKPVAKPPPPQPVVPSRGPQSPIAPIRPKPSKNSPVEPFNFPPNRPQESFVLGQPQENFDVNVKSDMKVGSEVGNRPQAQPYRPFGFLSKGQVKGVPLPKVDRPERPDNVRHQPPSFNEQPSIFNRNKQPMGPKEPSPQLTPPGFISAAAGNQKFNIPSSSHSNYHYKRPGFDPTSIIMEGGFKPIRKADGPIPPLGFEVEDEDEVDDDLRSQIGSNNIPVLAGDRPALVTLEPVFVPSDPDHLLPKNRNEGPVPVQLPEAVVPVVPGRPQQSYQQPRQPIQLPQPLQPPRQPLPKQQVSPLQPPFQRQPPSTKPPQRKATSSLSSFFGFGSNRRQQQKPAPISAQPPRPQQPQPDQRRPVPPTGPQRGQQLQISPQPPHLRQPQERPPFQDVDNYHGKQPQAPPNRQQNPKPQRLSGFKFLRRFLQGDRRQDFEDLPLKSEQHKTETHATSVTKSPTPPNGPNQAIQINQKPVKKTNAPVVRRPHKPGKPQPIMTFQGPLPPVISNKNSASRQPQKKAGRPELPGSMANVLDPVSASIIGGKPIQGVPVQGGIVSLKQPINPEERIYLERVLFGPGDGHTPRSFGSGSVDLLNEEIFPEENSDNFVYEDVEYSTDIPSNDEDYTEDTTGNPNDYYTENDDNQPKQIDEDHQGNDNYNDYDLQHQGENQQDIENHQMEVSHEDSRQSEKGSDSDKLDNPESLKGTVEVSEQADHPENSENHQDGSSIVEPPSELGLLLSDLDSVGFEANPHMENSSALAILKDIIANMNKEVMKDRERNSANISVDLDQEQSPVADRTQRKIRERRATDVDQHLDHPEEIDSSLLPKEHRGFDDEDEADDSHNHQQQEESPANNSAVLHPTTALALLSVLYCISRTFW